MIKTQKLNFGLLNDLGCPKKPINHDKAMSFICDVILFESTGHGPKSKLGTQTCSFQDLPLHAPLELLFDCFCYLFYIISAMELLTWISDNPCRSINQRLGKKKGIEFIKGDEIKAHKIMSSIVVSNTFTLQFLPRQAQWPDVLTKALSADKVSSSHIQASCLH